MCSGAAEHRQQRSRQQYSKDGRSTDGEITQTTGQGDNITAQINRDNDTQKTINLKDLPEVRSKLLFHIVAAAPGVGIRSCCSYGHYPILLL